MFILRKVTNGHVEINIDLGDSYTLIRKDWSYDEFMQKSPMTENDHYALIVNERGDKQIVLSSNDINLILNRHGETFEKP